MPDDEFEAWLAFHRDSPLDDEHRIYRPAALIAYATAPGAKGGIEAMLDWLQKRARISTAHFSEADLATMKAFGAKPPRRKKG